MKKVFLFLSAIVFLVSGCSFDVHMVTPAPAVITLPSATPIIFPPSETPFVPTDTPVPGFTPEPGASLFYGAHAVENPNDPPGRSSFPVGTKRIYVVWHYQNMRAGLTIKREWYLDGKLWLQREEPWDFARYGAFGTIQDISIYDDTVGLPSGVYQVQMYIDGLQQPIGADTMFGPELWLNFQVQSDEVATEAASPDFQWSASVINSSRLIVRDKKGTPTELFSGLEIPYFAWFPDSEHILFMNRDRRGQVSGTDRGIVDELWIADVTKMEIVSLYKSDTMLGATGGLSISPSGLLIATSEGTGDGDACFVSQHMLFLEMGASFKGVRVFQQKLFTGLPTNPDSSMYPSGLGAWQNDSEFVVPMKITCITDETLAGDYVFDVANVKAARK